MQERNNFNNMTSMFKGNNLTWGDVTAELMPGPEKGD